MYYVEKGRQIISLDGNELYLTDCMQCGRPMSVKLEDIMKTVEEYGLQIGFYETGRKCPECLEEQNKRNEEYMARKKQPIDWSGFDELLKQPGVKLHTNR